MKKLFTSFIIIVFSHLLAAQGSGKLLDYNGTSSYVSCGTIDLSGQALTMQGWVKVDNFKTSFPYITSLWGTETGSNQAFMRLGDASLAADKVQFVLYVNGRITKLDGSKQLQKGVWYHIAGVYNGSAMTIYVNGIQDVTRSVSGPISSRSTFQIGQNYAAQRTIDGQIDEVSVFKAALSQATIRSWMCQSIKSSHPNYSNLEAYWKFDKGTGTSVTDHSTKSHTGTLQNSPAWQTSSAAIGDTSIADYTVPYNLNLSHADGDSMVVGSVIGGPGSVHLYRVDKKPNSTTFPSGVTVYDTTRYWGVFYAEGTNPRGNIAYHYANNNHYKSTGSCMIDLARRNDNSGTSWTLVNASQSSSSLSKTSTTRSEFNLIYRSNKVIHKDTGKTICDGDSIKLEHSTTGMTYKWYKNNALISGATSNVLQAKTSGTYWLTAGLGSCTDTSFTFKLSTQAKPNVSLSPIGTSCPDQQFDTIQGGMPAGGKYLNTYISGNLFVIKTAGPGSHVITYEFTDQFGCSDTASQIKVVHPWPQVGISAIPKMCADSASFALTNGTPSGGTYYVNGGMETNFDASKVGAGKHAIKYQITDGNGCKNSDSIEVTVVGLPNVVLNLINKTACEYDAKKSLDGSNPSGGLYTGNGVSGFDFDPKTAGPGKHPITYTYEDRNTGCSNTAVDTFTVIARPTRPVVTQVGDSLKSTSASTYLWYDNKGNRQTASTQSFKPSANGQFYVVVKENGCLSNNSDTISFELTGVKLYGYNSQVQLFPNPASDFIKVETDKEITLSIYDLNGKLMESRTIVDHDEIPVSSFDAGVYIVEIKLDNVTERKRIVVQH
ncbi:MAG: hypothetical protein CL840_07070 [Crocinitomicaceae bacterium]|nr:hypothetical protein [Crocinitomicaceae bacterium]|tara:strand:- start:2000 stop:4492 length:2493 start_codon:yes stop_codon:yes gene_type:complete